MSRVLYVTYDGLLEPLGAAQVVPYVEGLAHRGVRQTVLSFEKSRDLADAGRRRSMTERLAGAGVEWVPRRYHGWPSVPATLRDVADGILAARRATRGSPPTVIHARGYVAGMIGLACKRFADASLLFDMRGLWVDERVEAGLWRSDARVTRVARRLERRLLSDADAVVVLTAQAPPMVEALAGRALPTVRVIPTCVDLARFRPVADDAATRIALGLRPGPALVCAGSLSTWYLAEQAFAIGAAFRRAGGGDFLVLTRETALADRLDRRFAAGAAIRSVDHDDMPRWLAACSAGLVAVRPGLAKRASAPTKVGEYLACGLAVAATARVGDLDAQFADTPAAFTFDPGEPAGTVAERLLAIATRAGRQRAARALAERFYALEDGVHAYAKLYGALGVDETPAAWPDAALREAS